MENKIMMPANYNVMNEEEMTYTTGGFDPMDLSLVSLVLYLVSGTCTTTTRAWSLPVTTLQLTRVRIPPLWSRAA